MRTADDLEDFRRRAKYDMASVAREMEWRVTRTSKLTADFLDWLAAVQNPQQHPRRSSRHKYEGMKEVAKFFLDTSADGLMVGASIISGGAAAVVLAAAGSTMKGWGKFQDTDNVGAALMQGAGSLVFAVIPIANKLSGGQKWALVVVESVWESGTALVEGKGFLESAAVGSLKLAGPGVEKIFKTVPVKSLLEKAAVPMRIWVAQEVTEEMATEGFLSMATNESQLVLQKMGTKLVQKQVVERGVRQGSKPSSKHSAMARPERQPTHSFGLRR